MFFVRAAGGNDYQGVISPITAACVAAPLSQSKLVQFIKRLGPLRSSGQWLPHPGPVWVQSDRREENQRRTG